MSVIINDIPEFYKLYHGDKAILIDSDNRVCLQVSKKISDNLQDPEVQDKVFRVWKKQAELQKSIHRTRERINTLYLLLTRQCNMNCDFCAVNANHNMDLTKEYTAESIKKYVVPFLKDYPPHKLIITGGEPLIKHDLDRIADLIKNNVSCHIALQSNGLAVEAKIVDSLKNKVNEVIFSVAHMMDDVALEQRLQENIELFQNNGIDVALSFVYNGNNKQNLMKAIDNAAKYNTLFLLTNEVPVGRAKNNTNIVNAKNLTNLHLDLSQYILDRKYEDKSVAKMFFGRFQVRKSCGGYGKVLSLFPEGNIYMCQSMENTDYMVGNIIKDRPKIIIDQLDRMLELPYIQNTFCVDSKKMCRTCSYRYLCGGKCAVADDNIDPDCLMAKSFIDYSLFYFRPDESIRVNLNNYIDYLRKLT